MDRGILNQENIQINELQHPLTGERIKSFVPCSVIIPILFNPTPSLLFIQRSQNLKSHPGEIGFPGGIQEKGEDSLTTALREWEEELGTPRKDLEILGKYGTLLTVTGFQMDSYVGIYSGNQNFSFSEEVESCFTVPLEDFWEIHFYSIEFKKLGRNKVYYFYLKNHKLLWGATCELVYHFLRDLFHFSRVPLMVSPNLPTKPFLDPSKLS